MSKMGGGLQLHITCFFGASIDIVRVIQPVARTECNSFLNRLHQYTYNTSEAYLKTWMGSISPTAATLVRYNCTCKQVST